MNINVQNHHPAKQIIILSETILMMAVIFNNFIRYEY